MREMEFELGSGRRGTFTGDFALRPCNRATEDTRVFLV